MRLPALVLLAATLVAACADPAPAPAVVDAAAVADAAAAAADVPVAETAPIDVAAVPDLPLSACAKACAAFVGCAVLTQEACLAGCADADPCGETCVMAAPNCEAAADCLGAATPQATFAAGPYTAGMRGRAGAFTLPADDGDRVFEDHVNGRDSFVFLFTAENFKYAADLWKSNVKNWLQASPANVHYFFLFYADQKGGSAALAQVDAMRASVKASLDKLDAFAQCQWRPRIHFVEKPINAIPGALFEAAKVGGGVAHLGIDRDQRWRAIGMLQQAGGNPVPDLRNVTHEVRYWNFEAEREFALTKEAAKLVVLHAAKDGGGFDVTVDLPPASELAGYDALHLDLGGYCKDHLDKHCGEWDYVAAAYLCEQVTETSNPDAATACQKHVPGVAAGAEKAGLCKAKAAACKADADCGNFGPCEGFVAAVVGQAGVAAASKTCSCSGVDGEPTARKKTCKPDGSGFGACECPCPLEIGRWITPYRREGRWVSDATPFLAYLGRGGKQRISFDAANLPMVDFTLRFSKKAAAPAALLRPVKTWDLFTGGAFHQAYSDKYKPLTIPVPATTKKVELFALITGHGWGSELANCAEFCNHTHHFTVNGKEFVREHPTAGHPTGCADQVGIGTVPNQFGTWPIGRAGWCPGLDVKPFRVDVTQAIKAGGEAVVSYKGLFQGAPYKPQPNPKHTGGGFGADIRMRSWLVFYE